MSNVKQYRKKPVVVEAMKLTFGNLEEVDKWCKGGMSGQDPDGVYIMIDTLEGSMRATEGDFVIKGVNGEFYPCKPDIFAKTYEAVV